MISKIKKIKNFSESEKSEIIQLALSDHDSFSKSADEVLIASGSHDFLVRGFADYFEIKSSIGTPVEIINNLYTGKLSGEPTFSDGKVSAVQQWCFDNNLKLDDAIFYSDSINDLPMFEKCRKQIVVNPDEDLRKIAIDRLSLIHI